MSIKNILPNYKSVYHQSYYNVINKEKYTGKYPIICRSSMELKFCKYLDNNPNIKNWNSESFSLKYKYIICNESILLDLDKREHNYYPDFVFETINNERVIVEVKPKKQLIKPIEPKKKTKKSLKNYYTSLKMYIINISKINAVKKLASENNYKFIIITEDDLNKLII